MATIFRGPLFSSKQDKPPQSGSGWTVTPRFLTTLVLASAVPFKSPTQEVVAPPHPSHTLTANPDTSHGIPKTLYADASKAFFNPPHFTPVHKGLLGYLNQDASEGVPKVLYADARVAFFNPPHKAPDRLWPVTDTSLSSPYALLRSAFIQPPFVNAPTLAVERYRYSPDTTILGVLPGSLLAPFVNLPQPRVSALRVLADTSQSAFQALSFVPAPPFAQYDWPGPVEFRTSFVAKWDWQLLPDYIVPADVVVPDVVIDQGGGGGRKKKKRYIPLGSASEERERAVEAIVGQLHPVPEEPPPTDNRAALMAERQAAADKAAALAIQRAAEQRDDDDLAFILTL